VKEFVIFETNISPHGILERNRKNYRESKEKKKTRLA
jgi:hypothetical protein